MPHQSASIYMEDILFRYGQKTVLEHFNLTIDHGKIYALIGSSGSGKTTTLRLMNGLLQPHSGSIYIDGKKFNFKESEKWRRSLGYSIQGSGLFPHMTVSENLSIIARKEGWQKYKINQRIDELCQLVNLPNDPQFLNKKPREISGGQQQRVGIARALFMSPKIILMDEPFSALDPITRSEIQKEFLALQKKLSLTIVLVTHDLPEAFSMAHEIVLLNEGKIEQKAKPSRFLLAPESDYVQKFMESHSPGKLLKEIYLYSVVNTDIYTALHTDSGIQLSHIESELENTFSTTEEAQNFLQKQNQNYFYWVDENKKFLNFQSFDGSHINLAQSQFLKATDHILFGMKQIMVLQESSMPVLNDRHQVVGVFSKGALDAL